MGTITRIRSYAEADRQSVYSLIEESKEIKDSVQRIKGLWDWLFKDNPFVPKGATTALVSEACGKIVGLVCSIYIPLKIGDAVFTARWGSNFMTLPRHRQAGIRLLKKAYDLGYYPYCAFANMRAAALEVKLGAHKVKNISSFVCVLHMGNLLRYKLDNRCIAFAGRIFWLFIQLFLLKRKPRMGEVTISQIDSFEDKFDTFWEKVSADYPVIVVRNQEYLNWRFVRTPLKYVIFVAKRKESILGYIVLRHLERNSLRRGYIVDMLTKADDKETIDALIFRAVSFFKENKCDMAECFILTSKRSHSWSLRRNGFIFKKVRSYFCTYSKDEKSRAIITNPGNWYITASDPDFETWI